MLVVIMGMLIFSGLAYVGEKDEKDTMFISMPQVGLDKDYMCQYPINDQCIRRCTGRSSP